MVVVESTSWSALQGVRNQHRLRGLYSRKTWQLEAGLRAGFENEFEIKRNKAHGGCLGIERR